MNSNDLVYKISLRARELADMSIDTLRSWACSDTETRSEAIRVMREQKHTRGEMIEMVLTEEFVEEHPGEIANY